VTQYGKLNIPTTDVAHATPACTWTWPCLDASDDEVGSPCNITPLFSHAPSGTVPSCCPGLMWRLWRSRPYPTLSFFISAVRAVRPQLHRSPRTVGVACLYQLPRYNVHFYTSQWTVGQNGRHRCGLGPHLVPDFVITGCNTPTDSAVTQPRCCRRQPFLPFCYECTLFWHAFCSVSHEPSITYRCRTALLPCCEDGRHIRQRPLVVPSGGICTADVVVCSGAFVWFGLHHCGTRWHVQ
jgi:hypothetical protein